MVQQILPNTYRDWTAAYERGKSEGEAQKLKGLASLAYGSSQADRQSILGQIAGISPDFAAKQEEAFNSQEDRRKEQLVGMARGWKSVPSAQRQAYYERFIAPAVGQMGFGDLGQYDEASIDGIATQILAAYGGGKAQNPYEGLPSDIQSLKLLQSDPTLAALDRERRQAAGMVPKLVETNQGIGWGTPGAGINLAPIEGVAGGTQQAPAQAPQLFAALGQKYGIQPTSVTRTPERNRQVGGVANSYHLTGQAADFVVPQQMKAQFIQDARQNGYEAIDEGDHIHIEPASRRGGGGNIAQPFQKPQAPSDLERRLQMADQMGATAEEKRRMVIGGESGRDAQRISAKDATTARQKITQIRAARQQINSARQAFQKLKGTFSAGLGGQYLPTPEGQAFDRAIANLAPLITAVTRVPGVGAMSDYESRLQNAALPSRGTYEDVTAQQFQDLENLLNTVEAGYNDLLSGGQAAPTAADEADDIDSLLDMYR
jgi:hypothetical protein